MNFQARALPVVLSIMSINAMAAGGGFYIGGSAGYSSFNQDEGDLQNAIQGAINEGLAAGGPLPISSLNTTIDVDDTDIGFKFYGGYRFNDYFGMEAGYIDLGETTVDTRTTFTITTPIMFSATIRGDSSISVDGFSIAGVGSYPIGEKFDVFAKAGAFIWSSELDLTVSSGGIIPPESFSADDDGTDFMFGLGARYNFNKSFAIRAEWERYSGITVLDDDDDIDLFSGGVEFRF